MNDQRSTGVGEAPGQARHAGAEQGGPDVDPTARSTDTAAPAEDLDTIRRQRDEYYDQLLRKAAEFDNYRRRSEKERRELVEYANADLLRDILPFVDDLERALAAASDARTASDPVAALQSYRTGVELIQRQLADLLRKKGVTPIEALGADFDPHVHQAVTSEPSAAHREGEVMAELRKGYKLGDRLLRPAMVKVAKG